MNIKKNNLPALLGGEPAMITDQNSGCRWPVLTDEDERAVLEVMRDGNISNHPVIRKLEQDYRKFTGRKYALAHCNGTTALLAAFHAIGLKPGDEVLVPTATFWASVLPMLWLGAIPVFCESEGERLGLDPDDLEKKITPKTRAIVVVHLWGLPCKMTKIFEIAGKHNLKIIEDASHAHGAFWREGPCGSLGDISVFSLQGDKLAPGGEGGIFLCDDYEYFERAVCLGDITRIIELETPAKKFAATSFGLKTRIAPLSAAIARVQLRRLDENNWKRNANILYLCRGLEEMSFHTFLPPEHIRRVYFEFIVRADPWKITLPVDVLTEALQAEGCEVSVPRYPLLHQQPFFTEDHFKKIARLGDDFNYPDYRFTDLPKTRTASQNLLKLPSFPNADRKILDRVLQAFEKIINAAPKIYSKHHANAKID